ncbi:hypothetical protein VI26_13760 [Chromobacterium sp. LK1]|uniref:hypothetical protein n=1 Tax=Chromobacterium sp. LK1 TaxID=1628193 RepID=UPI000653D931|nr:hypothetical protein [Chromobacterium sp. LK1]KMN34980.1 hypothetical protein VI26_13760 [Chromobacterium sp. LK1]
MQEDDKRGAVGARLPVRPAVEVSTLLPGLLLKNSPLLLMGFFLLFIANGESDGREMPGYVMAVGILLLVGWRVVAEAWHSMPVEQVDGVMLLGDEWVVTRQAPSAVVVRHLWKVQWVTLLRCGSKDIPVRYHRLKKEDKQHALELARRFGVKVWTKSAWEKPKRVYWR